MDILTPRGQETLKQERRALELFLSSYGGSGYGFVETPKDQPADIDGFIHKEGVLVCGIEVKCRNMSVEDLKSKFANKWLITNDKLDRGVSICERLCIDFKGFLYLAPDDLLLVVPIWSAAEKAYKSSVDIIESRTQKTVNGGTIVRLNAYVDVSSAKAITQK